MSGRPANRRAGREAAKDNDLELDLLNRVLESVRKAKEHNDESRRLGQGILQLEDEIKTTTATGRTNSLEDMYRRLDDLYRQQLRRAEDEKKIHDEEDMVNNLAILATMRGTDEPLASTRGNHGTKGGRTKNSQNSHKPNVLSDVLDSPDISPGESTTATSVSNRVDVLKRNKLGNNQQRAGSVASNRGTGTNGSSTPLSSTHTSRDTKDPPSATKDTSASDLIPHSDQILHKGLQAEKAGTLTPGTHVFLKYRNPSSSDHGVGMYGIIKKVHTDRRPIGYDVQDPEPDAASGQQKVHKATARDLYPIPAPGSMGKDEKGVAFPVKTTVYARYPDTDTFYEAEVVRGLKGGEYTLRFEGEEEDDKEQGVERRFVLDTRMR